MNTEPVRILVGDVIEQLATLPERSVHCAVTSPPYWGLRDYGVERQIGLEPTPEAFVEKVCEVFDAVWRVLRDDGSLWLNIGDSYAGSGRGGYAGGASTLNGSTDGQDNSRAARVMQSRRRDDAEMPRSLSDLGVPGLKPKDLCMMPYRVVLALQARGWYVRSQIIWAKKSPMPESCQDRPTSSHEPIFLLAKRERYFYDAEAVKEAAVGESQRDGLRGGDGTRYVSGRSFENSAEAKAGGGSIAGVSTRNMRNVWHLGPEPYKEAHFATFPTEIPRRAILAGTSAKGCCPACGAPWRRVVERVATGQTQKMADGWDTGPGSHGSYHREGRAQGEAGQAVMANRTIGWEPGCACNAGEPVPCVVLDPFLGSGTTVAVARTLGRYGVGCELNPEYVKLARERIGKAEKPATFRSDKVEDAPLFGVEVQS